MTIEKGATDMKLSKSMLSLLRRLDADGPYRAGPFATVCALMERGLVQCVPGSLTVIGITEAGREALKNA
jgi:hypothetical protein